MKMGQKTCISKMDAATAQLETAIKLYFEDRDLLSSYTLCAAADGILEDIWRHEKNAILARRIQDGLDITNFMFSAMEEWNIRIEDAHKKEAFRLLNSTRNFLKHADNDHKKIHHFHKAEETGLRIFMACRNFRLVSELHNASVNVFVGWFLTLNPHYLSHDNMLKNYIPRGLGSTFNHSEVTAIGYNILKKTCPELFPSTDLESRIGGPRYTFRIPLSGGDDEPSASPRPSPDKDDEG